jgi:hypothetical protein
MGVGKRVKDTLDRMSAGDKEGALECALLGCAATSTKIYRKILRHDNERFREFIKSNIDIITDHTLVLSVGTKLRLEYDHPNLKPTPDGLRPLEEVLYHIRNHQVHESSLPDNIKFTDELLLSCGSPLVLPSTIIFGLAAAVLVAPINRNEYLPPSYTLTLNGRTVRLNDYWGKRKEYLDWFELAQSAGGGYGFKGTSLDIRGSVKEDESGESGSRNED